jgi:hypothetical protein
MRQTSKAVLLLISAASAGAVVPGFAAATAVAARTLGN